MLPASAPSGPRCGLGQCLDTIPDGRARRSGTMTWSPLCAGIVKPALEVLGHEAQRSLTSANADRGDSAFSGRGVEPGSRDAQSSCDLCGLEEVDQGWLIAVHTAIDRQRAKRANEFVAVALN